MGESIFIAIQIYLIAFVVAIIIAFLIKGMLSVIRHITPKKQAPATEQKGSEVSL